MKRFLSGRASWVAMSIAFVAAALALPSAASAAPTRSFTAASSGFAADTEVLASVNLKVARSTQLFSLATSAITHQPDVKTALGAIKKTCGIDALTAIDDVTVGVDQSDKGGIYLALTGVTEDQFEKCVSTIAKEKTGEPVTIKKTGSEIELSHGSDKIYVAWLANNVLFLGTDPEDEALLKKELGGGMAKAAKMAQRLAKVDTDAAAFFTWTREEPIQSVTEHGGSATINYVAGVFAMKLAVDLADSKEAEKLAKGANAALSVLVPRNAPKEAQKIVDSIQVKATGAEVDVGMQAAEADLQKLVGWIMTQ